jgi:hypothetical protein
MALVAAHITAVNNSLIELPRAFDSIAGVHASVAPLLSMALAPTEGVHQLVRQPHGGLFKRGTGRALW